MKSDDSFIMRSTLTKGYLMSIPEIKIFEEPTPKLSKRQRKKLAREQQSPSTNTGLQLKTIKPLTINQNKTFQLFNSNKNLLLTGSAGTGKSFASIYLALNEILNNKQSPYKKLIIIRSAVEGRKIGFLPGNNKSKIEVYESPYIQICSELFGRSDAYSILKQKKIIDFESTSFLRGLTFRDCIVLTDEVQNMTFQEQKTIITRYGDNCKMIFSGDTNQIDLIERIEQTGLYDFIKIINKMKSFTNVNFTINDIVRNSVVKEFLMAEDEHFSRS